MKICVNIFGPKRSSKVKITMALYLKIHFTRCTNYACTKFYRSAHVWLYAALLNSHHIRI